MLYSHPAEALVAGVDAKLPRLGGLERAPGVDQFSLATGAEDDGAAFV